MTAPREKYDKPPAKRKSPLARVENGKKDVIEGAPKPLKVETKSRAE